MSTEPTEELQRVYSDRFGGTADYRQRVWAVLLRAFFQPLIPQTAAVLDLGCGYGEFVNQVRAGRKFAMDLNPDAKKHLLPDVVLFHQDCSQPWPLKEGELDVVFTSNFFEHLPDKPALGRTLDEIFRCLKTGGQLIALGPNIKFTSGRYWDFWDHHLPLTELS